MRATASACASCWNSFPGRWERRRRGYLRTGRTPKRHIGFSGMLGSTRQISWLATSLPHETGLPQRAGSHALRRLDRAKAPLANYGEDKYGTAFLPLSLFERQHVLRASSIAGCGGSMFSLAFPCDLFDVSAVAQRLKRIIRQTAGFAPCSY